MGVASHSAVITLHNALGIHPISLMFTIEYGKIHRASAKAAMSLLWEFFFSFGQKQCLALPFPPPLLN